MLITIQSLIADIQGASGYHVQTLALCFAASWLALCVSSASLIILYFTKRSA